MPAHHEFPYSPLPPGRKAGFLLLILLVSLLAHLFIIQWATDRLAMVALRDDQQDIISVTLQTTARPPTQAATPDPTPPATPASEEKSPPPLPDAPVTSPPPAANEVAAPVVAEPVLATPPDQTTRATNAVTETAAAPVAALPPEPAASPAPGPLPALAPPEPSRLPALASPEPSPPPTPAPPEPIPTQTDAATAAPAPAPSATADRPQLFSRISLPPSADLSYDAVAIKGSSKVEGRGLVKWVQNGRQYSITGEASVLFLSVLSYRSEGYLGDVGILPELYTEKRLGKSSTNTHFHRERQTISFSASTNSYAVKGGEQDRGSVFWQLAGLARGNPDRWQAGLSFDLIIAGSRTADPWRVTVHGTAPIALGQGRTDAWHMTLARPDGGNDYQLEVWLAPAQDWYPVKIMYVDRKGTSLGLTLSKLEKK